jgi:2-oxoglutarate dehydrogenase E1 component
MATTLQALSPAINGWNAEYIQQVYQQYRTDRDSVPVDMQAFFAGFDLAMQSGGGASAGAGLSGQQSANIARLQVGLQALVDAYRRHGHYAAKTDPFHRPAPGSELLNFKAHGLSDSDLDQVVHPGSLPVPQPCTLRKVIDWLESTYCSTIGVQYMHVDEHEQRAWLQQRIESSRLKAQLSKAEKADIYEALVKAEQFEVFLQNRYKGQKRFSLEGGESTIPTLHRILAASKATGAGEVIMGMAHRGRLNVLNNVLGKSYRQILTEFEGTSPQDYSDGGGDVKYHKGFSGKFNLSSGEAIDVALASNPSHLESVAAVVLGRVRAKQRLLADPAPRHAVVPVIIHGDAAVIGQGIVAELCNMSQLDGYTSGGAIHLVINNLIGFTTAPVDSRTGPYCTDVAFISGSPVLHVNGMDPEACVFAAQLATEFRQKFQADVWIDLVCYRKYGHNEQDEPAFTNPILSTEIKKQQGVVADYAARLISEGVLTESQFQALKETVYAELDKAQAEVSKKGEAPNIDPGGRRWAGYGKDYSFRPVNTAVSKELLAEVCNSLGRLPDGFELHKSLKPLVQQRGGLIESGLLTHADAEVLAFGTLLLEGTPVRLSGQDCRRGTFSQRHAVLRDQNTGEAYTPLNMMRPIASSPDDAGKPGADGKLTQSRLCVYDSPLSEEAVIGFDFGYSLADPNMLVIWEGQFGDFVNGAQVILDQYLASAEIKWRRWSGLTLMLPHGYEGAGPEHSSARVERFLQLCAADNMQVCYPSTGAQHFHLLRRQVSRQRKFRKPLIILTPKSLLRSTTSTVAELFTGSFREIIDDPMFEAPANGAASGGKKSSGPDRKGVKQVIFCSGKIYHELAARREATGSFDKAIVRIEQYYPLHTTLLHEVLGHYPASAKLIYCQEEPRNAGAYLFLDDLFRQAVGKGLEYIGRPASPTPATGSPKKHAEEQEAILSAAIAPLAAAKKAPAKAGS